MDVDPFLRESDEHWLQQRARAWTGTLAEYWELAQRQPAVTQSAAARAYQAILAAGSRRRPDGRVVYPFFADVLFGIDDAIEAVMSYLSAAARGLETRRRILLLVGPPGSGKSTLVNRLKAGIEEYTTTDAGALYAIDGCPIHEEPLRLLPERVRPALRERYGITVEGEPCPRCRYVLETEHQGRASAMPVRRIVLSRAEGIGFGSYVATAPHAVDPQVLIGTTDEAALSQDRRLNAALAFRYDGQLFAANRGVMEFVDPFKLDERFLNVLNVVSEERRVPTVRFGSIDVDLVLVAHTNEAEYRRFLQSAETAALQDRFVVVRVPYTVEVSAEEAIYRKLLAVQAQVAVSPLAWRVAATWAVLTRLAPARSGLALPLKARLYDGEGLPGVLPDLAARERAAAPDEGMAGVGPRYVVNRLAVAAATAHDPCVGHADVLAALWQGLAEHPQLAARDRQSWAELFRTVQEEADRLVQRDVRRAAIDDYPQHRRRLVDDYLAAAAAVTEAPGARLEPRWLQVLTRVEDRLRLSMADRRRMRAALAGATDRAACERWLETAVDAEILPGWPAVAAQVAADRATLERIGARLAAHLGYDPRCVETVLARAWELAALRTTGAPGRWPWA